MKEIQRGYSAKWDYEWRVVEILDSTGKNPVYAIERNQGKHDGRFFQVGHFLLDKTAALCKANYLFEKKRR